MIPKYQSTSYALKLSLMTFVYAVVLIDSRMCNQKKVYNILLPEGKRLLFTVNVGHRKIYYTLGSSVVFYKSYDRRIKTRVVCVVILFVFTQSLKLQLKMVT